MATTSSRLTDGPRMGFSSQTFTAFTLGAGLDLVNSRQAERWFRCAYRRLRNGTPRRLILRARVTLRFCPEQLRAYGHVRAAQAGEQPVLVVEGGVRRERRKVLRVAQVFGAPLQPEFQNEFRDGSLLWLESHMEIALGAMRNAGKLRNRKVSIAQMAFDVFIAQEGVTAEQRERCSRALRHTDAPKTAQAWRSFTEMLELAVGPMSPRGSLALVEEQRPKSRPMGVSRRPHV